MIEHALGLACFKDGFRTLVTEEGCAFMEPEPNPELQTYVSSLSGGPVGPGDMAGQVNKTLTLMTCMPDGKLLKPSVPAMSIDSMFYSRSFKNDKYPDG